MDVQRYHIPLLQEHIRVHPGDLVLELGYYDPAAALWAAQQGATVVALRPSIDVAAELERLAAETGTARVSVRLAWQLDTQDRARFDTAILLAPFFLGNRPVRDAIQGAAAALKPEGALYFQVHRRHGGATFVRYAGEHFERVELLGMGGGQRRLYRATRPKPAPAAAAAPVTVAAGIQEPAETLQHVSYGAATVTLRLVAGVFASRGIDPGSRLLLETVEVPAGASILDLGCGAGTLGLALAAGVPQAKAVLVDASSLAVDLARENALRNGLTNVDVRLANGYDAVPRERFDVIVSNLPAHRGHQAESETAHRFIAGAPEHLHDGGEAWFVTNRALPYELVASRAFREVRVAANDGRYKVLRCTAPRRME